MTTRFGTPVVRPENDRTITVSNIGEVPLDGVSVRVSGVHSTDFSIVQNGCSSGHLGISSSCIVTVRFTPTWSKERQADVVITLPTGPRSVGVSGTGRTQVLTGTMTTTDAADSIQYRVELGAIEIDKTTFILGLGPGITWRKEMDLPTGSGTARIGVQDNLAPVSQTIPASALLQSSIKLRKAKTFGIMAEIWSGRRAEWEGGAHVTLTWVRD
jgi:hypothetical protein